MSDKPQHEKSAIDEHYRTDFHKKTRPDFSANYWKLKNYSNRLKVSITDKDGNQLSKVVKYIEEIQDDGYFQRTIAKFCNIKSKRGYGAIPIYFVMNKFDKKIPRLKVADGVVRYSKLLNVDEYIEVIENLTTGIAPVIKITRYGRWFDTFHYELQGGYVSMKSNEEGYNKEDDEQLKKILSTTGKTTHNNGVVRAILFINRAGDIEDGSESYGLSDTHGFDLLIEQLDDVEARINMIIDQDAGNLEIHKAVGSISLGALGTDTETTGQLGLVKVHETTLQNVDNMDITYIPGNLTHQNLIDWRSTLKRDLNTYQGMQVEYDSEGKTNETNAKVDKVGDMAFKEAKRRQLEDEEFWSDLFSTLIIISKAEDKRSSFLDEDLLAEIEKIDRIKVSPRGSDIRKLFEMIQHMDKLGKIVSQKDMYQLLFDVSDIEAERMFNEKDDEVMKSIVAFGSMANGNIPQNLKIKGLKWAEQIEEEPETEEVEEVKDEKDVK